MKATLITLIVIGSFLSLAFVCRGCEKSHPYTAQLAQFHG